MKLKVFNSSNSKQFVPGEPVVRINSKAGLISFSKAAGELLSFTEKSKVVFVQDEENPADWYVHVTTDIDGFSLRKKSNATDYSFNCSAIAKCLLESIRERHQAEPYKASGFNITKTPLDVEDAKYWLIITANPINPR